MSSNHHHINYERLTNSPKQASCCENMGGVVMAAPPRNRLKRPRSAFGPFLPSQQQQMNPSSSSTSSSSSSSSLCSSNLGGRVKKGGSSNCGSVIQPQAQLFTRIIAAQNSLLCVDSASKKCSCSSTSRSHPQPPPPPQPSAQPPPPLGAHTMSNILTKSGTTANLFFNSFASAASRSRANMFMMRPSKSINEESPDYEAIKALRESVDSLVYKFDENSATPNTSANFRISLIDLNKEFSALDNEFSANNWADMQNEEYLKTLNKNVRNRQENIFEFMKTELNYVKILTITQKVYVNVMLNDCRIDAKHLEQMFPDLDRFAELHKCLLEHLIERYKVSKNKFIDSIGDILLKIFDEKSEDMVEIYSKVCCMHLTAKSAYKQLSTANKLFATFLQECQKNKMLKRYQIPDCLTIITQRLTKYLTLIENMINNSKDEKNDSNLLCQALDKLKFILNRVNDAVAFYQNSNEFKKIYENIDSKSYTYSLIKVDKQIEQRKITKTDLINKSDRQILSLNNVIVKCMSKNGKVYKDVTCLTMSDMIVFLHLNDKTKYVFMNENSVIPCTNGILIRPKVNEINPSRSTSFSSSNNNNTHHTNLANVNNNSNSNSGGQLGANQSSSQSITSNSITNSSVNSSISGSSNISGQIITSSTTTANNSSAFTLPSYIVNTITNEIIEIKFPDEISRNQWLNLVHTHITPFLEENLAKEESSSQLDTLIHSNSTHTTLSVSNSFSGTSTQQQLQQHKSSSKGSLKQLSHQQQQQLSKTQPLTSSSHRCNSNCSSTSSSSGQGTSIISSSSSATTTNKDNVLSTPLPIVSAASAEQSTSAAVSPNSSTDQPLPKISDDSASSSSMMMLSPDLQLSADLADLLYSFNNIIEGSVGSMFHGNLMRSASSAGETITKNIYEVQVSIPKRAETFNGASSTSKEEINICCSDIIKSRMMYMKAAAAAASAVNGEESSSAAGLIEGDYNEGAHPHSCSSSSSSSSSEDTKSEKSLSTATMASGQHHHIHHNHRHRLSLDTTSASVDQARLGLDQFGTTTTTTLSGLTSTDSGYQSRICGSGAIHGDVELSSSSSCSCVFLVNENAHQQHPSTCCCANQPPLTTATRSVSRKSSGISRQFRASATIEEEQQKSGAGSSISTSTSNTNLVTSSLSSSTSTSVPPTKTIPRAQAENIIRYMLSDYMRLKRELESKDKTIDLLKKTIDECKSQLDAEKKTLQRKHSEIEKAENESQQRHLNQSHSSENTSTSSTNSNKLSILVKCERSLLSGGNNNTQMVNKSTSTTTAETDSSSKELTSKAANSSSILFL